MSMLDAAGTVLPEGIRFFTIGWWVIHLIAVALVFAWGYRKGRKDERRERGAAPGQRSGSEGERSA
jgi:hypothetical protein